MGGMIQVSLVDDIVALRAVIHHEDGDSVTVRDGYDQYVFEGASTAADDGSKTLKPDNVLAVNPGRWVKQLVEVPDLDVDALIDVLDEGVLTKADVDELDFVGDGVTVTPGPGGRAIVTIPGAAAGDFFENGGNAFGADADLGLNDNFSLNFRTNGSTRMRLTSVGQLLIGLTVPITPAVVEIDKDQDAATQVRVYNNSATANATTHIGAGISTGTILMEIFGDTNPDGFLAGAGRVQTNASPNGLIVGPSNSAPLRFSTNGLDRARILSTGELAFGVSVLPFSASVAVFRKNQNGNTSFFVVNGTAGTAGASSVQVQTDASIAPITAYMGIHSGSFMSSGLNVAGEGFYGTDSSVGLNIRSDGNAYLRFSTNGTERARILSTGFFGIGTNAPSVNLHVRGLTNDNGLVVVAGNGAATFGGAVSFHTGTGVSVGAIGHSGPSLGSGTDMVLLSAVGTALIIRPGASTVTVKPASGNSELRLEGSAANSGGVLTTYDGTSTQVGIVGHSGPATGSGTQMVLLASAGKNLQFYTNGPSERMRVLSSGELLVNTMSEIFTSAKLQVLSSTSSTAASLSAQGTSNASAALHGSSENTSLGSGVAHYGIRLDRRNKDVGRTNLISFNMWDAPEALPVYAACGSVLKVNTGGAHEGDFAIWTATAGTPTEKSRVTAAGNLLVGTATESGSRIQAVKNFDGATTVEVTNNNGGGGVLASFYAGTAAGGTSLGTTGSGWSSGAQLVANEGYLDAGSALVGLTFRSGNASGFFSWRMFNGSIYDELMKLTSAGALQLIGAGTGRFIESNNGAGAGLSGAATGRLRYNNTTGTWQASTQGGAYVDLLTEASQASVAFDNLNTTLVHNADHAVGSGATVDFTVEGSQTGDNNIPYIVSYSPNAGGTSTNITCTQSVDCNSGITKVRLVETSGAGGGTVRVKVHRIAATN